MTYALLLNQTITLYQTQTIDEYGRVANTVGTDYNARFERVHKNILQADGNTLTIDGIVYINPGVAIENDDKITYGGNDYKVVAVDTVVGKLGSVHHYELKVVKWR